jgi:hypothetical protein
VSLRGSAWLSMVRIRSRVSHARRHSTDTHSRAGATQRTGEPSQEVVDSALVAVLSRLLRAASFSTSTTVGHTGR